MASKLYGVSATIRKFVFVLYCILLYCIVLYSNPIKIIVTRPLALCSKALLWKRFCSLWAASGLNTRTATNKTKNMASYRISLFCIVFFFIVYFCIVLFCILFLFLFYRILCFEGRWMLRRMLFHWHVSFH